MFFITNAISVTMLLKGIFSISLICHFFHKKCACESTINTQHKGTVRKAIRAGCFHGEKNVLLIFESHFQQFHVSMDCKPHVIY